MPEDPPSTDRPRILHFCPHIPLHAVGTPLPGVVHIYAGMTDLYEHILFLLSRYLHIVCTTVVVGGTLFYEMVVPIAIDDLKREAQLGVFGRARWTFRWLVWSAGIVLIVSGIATSVRHWRTYSLAETAAAHATTLPSSDPANRPSTFTDARTVVRPGWWWAAHTSSGLIAVTIALMLTGTRRPPDRPVGWMRLNLVILLVVMFLGSVTLQVRRIAEQRMLQTKPTLPIF